jgi:serine/threonine-protein kinase
LLFTPTFAPLDIRRVKIGGDRKIEPVLQTNSNSSLGEISPDGRWLLYQSNESGRSEIYVRPYPDVNAGRWQISTAGGSRGTWNPKGGEVFYMAPGTAAATALMSVRIELGAAFKAGTPQVLFQGPYLPAPALTGRPYSPSPDGTRFLMIKSADATGSGAQSQQIVVVQNWTEELKRRVPAGTK